MPTNAEVGVTPLPEGDELHWSGHQLPREAAGLVPEQAADGWLWGLVVG